MQAPASRRLVGTVPVPNGAAGIIHSPDGRAVLVVDNVEPALMVIDTSADTLVRRVPLTGLKEAPQRVCYSPDRRHVLVASTADPVVTTLGAGLERQRTVLAGKGPMGVAFHAHGRAAPVANHGGNVTVVDLEAGLATTELPARKGIETLAHF